MTNTSKFIAGALLASSALVGSAVFQGRADGNIVIPATLAPKFDQAWSVVNDANNRISKIRSEVEPSSRDLTAICETTLLLNGVKREDFDKYELDAPNKLLRLKLK